MVATVTQTTFLTVKSLNNACTYMRITLKHIAEKLGVTVATVSLAMKNSPRISRARREEIQRAAQALGYRPNALVASLMAHIRQARAPTQRTGLLYLVTGSTGIIGPPKATPVLHYRGAREQAARHGFNLEVLWVRAPGMTDARIAKIIRARNIPGVIVAPREDELPFPQLPWELLSSVMISHSYEAPALDRVYPNFITSARMAVDHLRQQRKRPVRLILPWRHDRNVHHLWTAGYLQHSRGLRGFQPPLIDDNPAPAVAWVKANPGGVVLGTHQVITWLSEAGLRRSIDFDYISLNVENDPTFTGIREPSLEIGAEAVDRVIGRLHLNQTGIPPNPRITLIEPYWQQGN